MAWRRQPRSAKAALAWSLVCLAALHVGIHVYLERCHPEAYDPEFAARFGLLRSRIAEAPDRPLLLVVGSSRLVTDFRPERLPDLEVGEREKLLTFNFSHTGAGPLINLMEIRRLLRQGVRPRWLVVEVLPSMLATSGRSTAANLAAADDLPFLFTHMPRWKGLGSYLHVRFMPSPRHYLAAAKEHGPAWAFAPSDPELAELGPLGGSTPLKTEATPENVRRCTEEVRAQYYPGLQNFQISDVADQSLRELIELCRLEKIELVLVLTPESSEFRGWYPQSTEQMVQGYCEELRRRCAVSVIDARAWLPDEDFLDSHHALPHGAEIFTLRLGREVLEPLIRGTLRP
jgi:hypothetical protein